MGRKKVYKQLLCRHCHEPIHFMMAMGYWIVKTMGLDGAASFTFQCQQNPRKDYKLHQPMDNLSYLAWKHEQKNK